MSPTLTIGDVARASRVPAKTIRYYEDIALLPKPVRAANGYRLYDEGAVDRLRFIRRARDLGFPIADVSELLSLYDDPNRTSADVRELATAHMAAVDAKLAELTALRETLSDLVARCPGSDDPHCPILNDLTGSSEE